MTRTSLVSGTMTTADLIPIGSRVKWESIADYGRLILNNTGTVIAWETTTSTSLGQDGKFLTQTWFTYKIKVDPNEYLFTNLVWMYPSEKLELIDG